MGHVLSSVAAALAWIALPACVCPPEARDVLAVGFRTPEQAFRTFQTATRLDDPDLELRCFSLGFRARNHVSQLTWREARAELYERQPWLRYGIARAEVVDARVEGATAFLSIDTAGGDYVVVLVREDFAEAWAGDARLLDEEVDWARATGIQAGGNDVRWVFGRVALPAGVELAQLTEIRFGREWKIDDIGEPTSNSSSPERDPSGRVEATEAAPGTTARPAD